MKKEKYFKVIFDFLELFGNLESDPSDSFKIYSIDLSYGLFVNKLKNIIDSMSKEFEFEDTYINDTKAKSLSMIHNKETYSLLLIEDEPFSKITMRLAYNKI